MRAAGTPSPVRRVVDALERVICGRLVVQLRVFFTRAPVIRADQTFTLSDKNKRKSSRHQVCTKKMLAFFSLQMRVFCLKNLHMNEKKKQIVMVCSLIFIKHVGDI
jgi:hypothetical protein